MYDFLIYNEVMLYLLRGDFCMVPIFVIDLHFCCKYYSLKTPLPASCSMLNMLCIVDVWAHRRLSTLGFFLLLILLLTGH